MGRLKGKRVRIGKYAVPALLLVTLAIGTVAAVVYVILTYTMTLPVVEFPAVNFYEWDTATRANTFTESFNIFPGVTTIQDNATYGIYSETASNISLRISDITTSTNIQTVYIKVFNASGTLFDITWTSGDTLPQSWTRWETDTGFKYSIWMEVTGASGAVPTTSSGITVEMKVEQ